MAEETHKVVELYGKGLSSQRRANANYWANFAFMRGDQWIHFNPHTKRLAEVPDDADRVRATINKILPGSRTVLSKLLQRPLVFEVTPNSADDVAIEGSKISDSILAAITEDHDWELLRESVAWSVWKGGTAAVCVDWNPNLGKPTALADDGRKLPSGDTTETALSVAEFVIQPGAKDARRANWWIKAQALPPEQVKATWKLAEVPEADATSGLSSLEKGMVMAMAGGVHGPDNRTQDTDLTLVLTYYERPNESCPDGKVEIVVNNKSVWGPKPWPFPFVDHLNLATCRETLVENTWLGETCVTTARPIQAAYNAAWSNILEHADIAGNAKLATPQSSIELMDQYSDVIGEQVVYGDGMDKPSWLVPPQLPSWLLQMPQELATALDDTLGVHDVSRGSAPQNIESGYGLAVLAEQDATPIGKLAASMAQMFSDVGTMVLKVYEDNVKETRTAVIKAPGEPSETTRWSGKDIAGQTTAKVPLELVAPRSRAAQAQFAEKAMQMGLITTLEDLTRLAESPGEREIIAAVRPDVDRARRENHAMYEGKVCFPENWDDHTIHRNEHNAFRKTARYEAMDAERKSLFAAHVQAHETLAHEEAGQQTVRNQLLGPAAPGVPTVAGSEALPTDPNAPPPPAEQTVMDQLANDPAASVARVDSQAAAEGAAEAQGISERDAILQLAQITQGGGGR